MEERWRRHRLVPLIVGTLIVVLLAYLIVDWFLVEEPPRLEPQGVERRLAWAKTNYSQIEEGLYVGGFVPAPPSGTRAVLNVCQSKDPYEAEVHRWDPIDDGEPAPGLDWLCEQVEFVAKQRRADLPIYVHCHAGISRSVMVVTAYLMARDGCTRDQALASIRSKRSFVRPNPWFMELLAEWEEFLKS
jgi:hypothetical protein